MTRAVRVIAEAWRCVRAQRATSIVVVILVAGLCGGVLATAGQTVAAEQSVLDSIDASGTRAITVMASDDRPLPIDLLTTLRASEHIEDVNGFGPITDAHLGVTGTGTPIAIRTVYGDIVDDWADLNRQAMVSPVGTDWGLASPSSTAAVGLLDGVGYVIDVNDREIEVIGFAQLGEHLRGIEPVVLMPQVLQSTTETSYASITLIVAVAESPSDVRGLESMIRHMLNDADHDDALVETSAALAQLRSVIAGDLGTYGRSTVLGALGLGAGLVCISLLAFMNARRKDYGRRRALGASRSLIMSLVLTQVSILAITGSVIGIGVTLAWQHLRGITMVDVGFISTLALGAIVTTVLAATIPALIASRRDPLTELRVP